MDDELWRQWYEQRSDEILWRLVERYRPFSRDVARYMHGQLHFAGAELDDFEQTAVLGLIDAIKGYDSGLGASFNHYARFRIRGAILNSLPKISERQSVQHYRRRLERERNKSLRREGAIDSVAELAGFVIQLSYSYLLDDLAGESGLSAPKNPYQQNHLRELRQRLRDAIGQLPERERAIIEGHYLQQQTFESVAEGLGLSKGRVSQIHRGAIERLREILQRQFESTM